MYQVFIFVSKYVQNNLWFYAKMLLIFYQLSNEINILYLKLLQKSTSYHMSYLEDYCEMAQSYHIQQRNSLGENGQVSPTFRASHLYKCYSCANKSNQNQNCKQCYGKGYIRQSHPLCNILSQILSAKLQNAVKICPIRQEQEIQEKMMVCNYCQKQCQNGEYYQCELCPLTIICLQCKQNNQHEHPMTYSSSMKQSQQKRCTNCESILQNLYGVCKVCEKNHSTYVLCHQCWTDKNYNHDHTEFSVQLMMDSRSLNKQKSDLCMEDDIDTFIPYKIAFKHSISQQMIQPRSPDRSSLFHLKTEQQEQFHLRSGELNTSIQPQSQNQIEQLKQSSPIQKKEVRLNIQQSQVMLQISLFQSQQYQQSPVLSFLNGQSKKALDSVSVDIKQVDSSEDQYKFEGYECDICKILPIKNIRYHCNKCDDFDLCRKCYQSNLQLHPHKDFSMINGKQRQKQKIQRMKKKVQNQIFAKKFKN